MLQPLISFFQLHKILQLDVMRMTSWYFYSTYVYNKVFKVMQGEFTLNFPLCLLLVSAPFYMIALPKLVVTTNLPYVSSILDPTVNYVDPALN